MIYLMLLTMITLLAGVKYFILYDDKSSDKVGLPSIPKYHLYHPSLIS